MHTLFTPQPPAPVRTYHPLSIGAHWLTLVLLIAVYALIELHDVFPKGSDARESMKVWHATLGVSVLGLTLIRLGVRAVWPAPSISASPGWQRTLGRAMHWTLYAFLIAAPLLGWMVFSAKGRPVSLFGLQLPALMPTDRHGAEILEDMHEFVGQLGYWLIGMHAAAALWHHHVLRDDTWQRMWPWAKPVPCAAPAEHVSRKLEWKGDRP